MNEKPYRPYEVVLLVTRRVSYFVDARTPEEAEEIAEEWLVEGESGVERGEAEVQLEDVLPVEELTSDEMFKSDSTGFHA